MTDLERARVLCRTLDFPELPMVPIFAEVFAAVRRDGAAEMRERAAQIAREHEAPTTARAILDLPLTPEEPT